MSLKILLRNPAKVSYYFIHVAREVEKRKASRFVAEKQERKRQWWKPSIRWEDNIKKDLKEIRCEIVDWIHLTGSSEYGNESLEFMNAGKSWLTKKLLASQKKFYGVGWWLFG